MNRANTLVWILLLGLTLLSFALGERHLPSAALFLVAAAKAWFVARHFMELRHASAVWTFATGSLIIAFVFLGIVMT